MQHQLSSMPATAQSLRVISEFEKKSQKPTRQRLRNTEKINSNNNNTEDSSMSENIDDDEELDICNY